MLGFRDFRPQFYANYRSFPVFFPVIGSFAHSENRFVFDCFYTTIQSLKISRVSGTTPNRRFWGISDHSFQDFVSVSASPTLVESFDGVSASKKSVPGGRESVRSDRTCSRNSAFAPAVIRDLGVGAAYIPESQRLKTAGSIRRGSRSHRCRCHVVDAFLRLAFMKIRIEGRRARMVI